MSKFKSTTRIGVSGFCCSMIFYKSILSISWSFLEPFGEFRKKLSTIIGGNILSILVMCIDLFCFHGPISEDIYVTLRSGLRVTLFFSATCGPEFVMKLFYFMGIRRDSCSFSSPISFISPTTRFALPELELGFKYVLLCGFSGVDAVALAAYRRTLSSRFLNLGSLEDIERFCECWFADLKPISGFNCYLGVPRSNGAITISSSSPVSTVPAIDFLSSSVG